MASLAELREKVTDAFLQRGRTMRAGTTYVRSVFLAGGAMTAGLAQFITWKAGEAATGAQVVGICGTVVVFAAAMHAIFFSEKDAGEQLALAQEVVAKAEERSLVASEAAEAERARLYELIEELPDIDRNIALYQCTKRMRDALEQATLALVGDEETLVGALTLVAPRQLAVAAGFSLADQYTICVYKAFPVAGDPCRAELRLVEHIRSIPCGKESARVWPEGKGVAGVAFSNAKEILVADLAGDDVRTIFAPDGMEREYDLDRYRSMVAVPILVAGSEVPWGMVTATNDRANHFNHEDQPGRKPEEAMRVLAGYAALAVAMVQSRERARTEVKT